jgi:hypothetical protein
LSGLQTCGKKALCTLRTGKDSIGNEIDLKSDSPREPDHLLQIIAKKRLPSGKRKEGDLRIILEQANYLFGLAKIHFIGAGH